MKNKLPPSNIEAQSMRNITSNHRLIIPFFQRPYTWTEKQIEEMFEDIISSFSDNEETYSFGNAQLLTFDRHDFYVIDGQQRLTTFLAIIEEFSKHIKNARFKEFLNSNILNYNDYRGNFVSKMLQRETENLELHDIILPDNIKKYISQRVEEIIKTFDNWEEKGGILEFLYSDITFLNQTYFATDYKNNPTQRKECMYSIMKHFLKMNTRGKAFNEEETLQIINILENKEIEQKEKKKKVNFRQP